MTKKIALFILLVTMGVAPVYAGALPLDSRQGIPSGQLGNVSNVVKSTPGWVYNITLVSSPGSSLTSCVKLFDLSAGPSGSATPVYEACTATANDTKTIDFGSAPMAFYNGILVDVSNGGAFIGYQ